MKTAMVDAISILAVDPVGHEARSLVEALCAEMSARYGRAPSPFSLEEAALPGSVFLVAKRDGELLGCGALRPLDALDEKRAELKRMYVCPKARRLGVGRKIIAALEEYAREFGYKAVLLETGILQPEAQRLYESCGYERIPAFGGYVGNATSVCYRKRIEA